MVYTGGFLMDEKDWLILETLYNEKNITRAAEQLYITQPALTYRLQALEQEFETKIVTRGKKGIEFTIEGEYVYHYSQKMQLEFKKVKEKIQNVHDEIQGTLRLAVSGSFAYYPLPSLLKDFLSLHPNLEINLISGGSKDVVHLVDKEDVHIGIIRGDHFWAESKHIISEEPLVIASKQKITLEQLPYMPRILYSIDYSLEQTIDNWWNSYFKKPPRITMKVNQMETCKRMVSQGLGYAIFPSLAIIEDEDLFQLKLVSPENNIILRKTALIYKDSSVQLKAVKAFVDFIIFKMDTLKY